MITTEVLSLLTVDNARVPAVLYTKDGSSPRIGVIFMHPVVDFQQHYATRPLAEAGFAVLGLNSRYARFEHAVIMERILLDLAEGVKLLRQRGCAAVALIGNSGGGSLVAFYQSQAERPDVVSAPDGQPPDLTRADLPRADALIELNAHQGRHYVLTMHLDPSVTDESDMFAVDSSLDMFDPKNGPPYDRRWLERYRAAQIARNEWITNWALTKLEELRQRGKELYLGQGEVEGQQVGVDGLDMPFVVHRTMADPRSVDVSIEPSDREPGTVWGPTSPMNWSVTAMGRLSTVRSWLSQYSWSKSNADGPRHVARTTVPLLVVLGTADRGCFESDARAYFDAATAADKALHYIKGGSHFMRAQPEKIREVVQVISHWLNKRFA